MAHVTLCNGGRMPETPDPRTFADLLRLHRTAAGLTQEELAERAGLSPRGVLYLERGGRQPYRDTVRRLADALALAGEDRALFEATGRRLPRAGPQPSPASAGAMAAQDAAGEGVAGQWVYLAHAQPDRLLVDRLRSDLQQRGLATWADDQDLPPGTPSWEQALRDAIRAASALLLIATPRTRTSRYIADELRIAELYGRRVLPVWAAGEEWMECVPLGWGGLQYLDARGDRYGEALNALATLASTAVAKLEPGPLPPPDWDLPEAATHEPGSPRNPYKGLRPFTGADAGDFFGRDGLVATLVARLANLTSTAPRVLALIGASGSGKSSVLLAGLLPRLQSGAIPGSDGWIYLPPLVPGTRPMEMLVQSIATVMPGSDPRALRDALDAEPDALLRLSDELGGAQRRRVVLVVDQFEELFSPSVEEQERRHWIDLLVLAATAPRGALLLLLTLRGDFYDRPLRYPELGALLHAQSVVVLPPAVDDLRRAIEGPAALPDVGLLSARTWWETCSSICAANLAPCRCCNSLLTNSLPGAEGRLLSGEAYRTLGGVRGALARHAEATYAALEGEEQRRLARALFLRLIDPGQTEQDTTRRRAALNELRAD